MENVLLKMDEDSEDARERWYRAQAEARWERIRAAEAERIANAKPYVIPTSEAVKKSRMKGKVMVGKRPQEVADAIALTRTEPISIADFMDALGHDMRVGSKFQAFIINRMRAGKVEDFECYPVGRVPNKKTGRKWLHAYHATELAQVYKVWRPYEKIGSK